MRGRLDVVLEPVCCCVYSDDDWTGWGLEAMGEEERLSYVSLTKRMDDRAV